MTAPAARVNANSGEVRKRRDFERWGVRLPGAYTAREPAPVRAISRAELMRRALECEAGWRERGKGRL